MNAQANIFAENETNEAATKPAKAISKKAQKPAIEKKPAAAKKKPAAKPAIEKKPAAKPAIEKKPAQKPVEPAFDAPAALELFASCIEARNAIKLSADNEANIKYLRKPDNRNELLAAMVAANKAGFDLDTVFNMMKNTVEGHNYIAVKVITKIRMLFVALALNDFERCDSYTKPILLNVEQVGALDTHDMCRTVSKRITSDDALRVSKQVENRKDSASTTAGTQASSTRNALGYIGVLNVTKGKKNDAATWADTKQARAVQALVKGYTDKAEQARDAIEQARKQAAHA